jgi:hypothetical protein
MTAATVSIEIEGLGALSVRLREDQTATVKALLRSLPFSSVCERWGDEVYFSAPFHSPLENDSRAAMEVGDVAFWPDGDAIALFFGRTPSSTDEKPRAYSPCNIIGTIEEGMASLKSIKGGAVVKVRAK